MVWSENSGVGKLIGRIVLVNYAKGLSLARAVQYIFKQKNVRNAHSETRTRESQNMISITGD